MAGTESEKPARGWKSSRGDGSPQPGSRRARIEREKKEKNREAKAQQIAEFKTYLKDLFPGKQKYYAAGIAGGILLIMTVVIWQLSPGPNVDRDSVPRPTKTITADGRPMPMSTMTAPPPKAPEEKKK